ncbi:acetate--CoA ligase family protein [bacterium]|nr:acetate--CoA ligase family protein [bacterium]
MITKELFEPRHIVVIGGSNDPSKPGGRVLKNLIEGGFRGVLYVVNHKENSVQGISCYSDVSLLPSNVDLAIISIPSKPAIQAVKIMAKEKNCKAFIVLSAGFSETGEEGKNLEEQLIDICNEYQATLIGPNCMGVLTPHYSGTFAGPLPELSFDGCDFATGSGATAAFILENGINMGVKFSSMYSVGNSAQTAVEDILEYWDETFIPNKSSKVKLLYLEKIEKPSMFLKHCQSLIKKGCRIAAIKAGTSEAGSRAASSHTGALATSDSSVEALFKKAGVIRCYSREELILAAAILQFEPLKGKNIAIITHAGGPGVMLSDALSKEGFSLPALEGEKAERLLSKLFPGSSVSNPIDFLATGTSTQLGEIIDSILNDFQFIDGIAVIFGSAGLFDVSEVYKVLNEKIKNSSKPIYPILPSIIVAKKEIKHFFSLGRVAFFDEVRFGTILGRVYNTPFFDEDEAEQISDPIKIEEIISKNSSGYLPQSEAIALLDAAGISHVSEFIINQESEIEELNTKLPFPWVMKVVGPLHKSDVKGVYTNVKSLTAAIDIYNKLICIEDAISVLIQPMEKGVEIFLGAKRDKLFGPIIFVGLGGIFVEVLKDISPIMLPISTEETLFSLKKLKGYKIFEGVRGEEGCNLELLIDNIKALGQLLDYAPEISEIDLNPIIGNKNSVNAVDVRIRITK